MAASSRIGDDYPARARHLVGRALGSSWRASSSTFGATTSVVRGLTRAQTPAEALMSTHARTFSFAARFLPEPQRTETINLYAFFRTLDDLVDESPTNPETRCVVRRELEAWERWIRSGLSDDAPRPFIGEPLGAIVVRRGIPPCYFLDFLAGLKSDLEPTTPANRAEMEHYGFQVASTVGLSLTYVFGVSTTRALNAAQHMGIAMQITNILRDIGGDLARGRFYLPATVLEDNDLTRSDVERMWTERTGPDERLRSVIREVVTWADEHYAIGQSGIPMLPEDVRVPVSISSRLYQQILRQLERNDYDSLRTRASTSTWQKLAEAYRCALHPAIPNVYATARPHASGSFRQDARE